MFVYCQVWEQEEDMHEKSNVFTVETHGRKYTKTRQRKTEVAQFSTHTDSTVL